MNLTRTRSLKPHVSTAGRVRERGQVIVIFAGAIVLFMLLLAVVVDVSWYWANTLRVQRAADAAALAGVVWLPQCPASSASCPSGRNARDVAIAEATKNSYVNITNATVTTAVDADNNRALRVSVSANVGTYFMRVIGISSIPATRNAKAEFIMPVPMGSPQNYYGVGQFLGTTKTAHGGDQVPDPSTNTGWDYSTVAVPASGAWTNPTRADNTANTQYAVSRTTNGSAQAWSTFNLTSGTGAIPAGAVIEGVEVRIGALRSGSGNPTTSCRLLTALSWDNGGTWTNNGTAAATTITLPSAKTSYTVGSASDLTVWGTNHPAWNQVDFLNTAFQLRLTFDKPGLRSQPDGVGGHARGPGVLPHGDHHADHLHVRRERGPDADRRPRLRLGPGSAELLGRDVHEGRQPPERRLLRPGVRGRRGEHDVRQQGI